MSDDNQPLENSLSLRALSLLIKIMLIIAWIIVGLPVWLAVVVRVMLISTVVSLANLIGNGSISHNFKSFEYAAELWPKGFKQIINYDILENDKENEKPVLIQSVFDKFFIETIYTICFFSLLYLTFFGSPEFSNKMLDMLSNKILQITLISATIVGFMQGLFFGNDIQQRFKNALLFSVSIFLIVLFLIFIFSLSPF